MTATGRLLCVVLLEAATAPRPRTSVFRHRTAAISLAILLTVSAVAAGSAPKTVLSPAYKGSSGSGTTSLTHAGCHARSLAGRTSWTPTTGTVLLKDNASAMTCHSVGTGVGGNSDASAFEVETVGIPLRVSSNGAHSVASAWSILISSAFHFVNASCPKAHLNRSPAVGQYSEAYCLGKADLDVVLSADVVDLDNQTWSSNTAEMFAVTGAGWETFSQCYNGGTPVCTHHAGRDVRPITSEYNAAGVHRFQWNGGDSLTLWTNGTGMLRTHHYVLVEQVEAAVEALGESYSVLGSYAASASASIDLTPLGAVLTSVTVS